MGKRRLYTAMFISMCTMIVLVAGCGGNSDSGAESSGSGVGGANGSSPRQVATSSLSKAEFIKRANGICGRLRGDWRRGFGSFIRIHPQKKGESRSDLLVKTVKVIAVPTLRVQTVEIRELGAPRGDETEVEAILDAFGRAAAAAGSLVNAKGMPSLHRRYEQAGLLAKEYGLDECVFPPGW